MLSQMLIVGVKHKFESPIEDTQNYGRDFIGGILNKFNPEVICFEDGYNYKEFKPSKREDRGKLYGYKWAQKKGKKVYFIDLRDRVSHRSSWKEINIKRERIMAARVKRLGAHKRVVLFIGENHRKEIVSMLTGISVDSLKMERIKPFEKFLIRLNRA